VNTVPSWDAKVLVRASGRGAESGGREIRDARVGGLVNIRRLLEPIGYVPPAEYEARYCEQAAVAWLTELALRRSRHGSDSYASANDG
jgi:hypothetical protein